MKSPILTITFLFITVSLFTQVNPPTKNNESARVLINPILFPYLPLINNQKAVDDSEIKIRSDRGIYVGLRGERYYPNHNKGFAVELEYLNRDYILEKEKKYFFLENSISVTPIFLWKRNNLEKVQHLFGEIGFRNQFVFNNDASVLQLNSRPITENNADIIKKYRLWGYLGLGLKRDFFRRLNTQTKVTNFSFGLYFSLFNQSNNFSNKAIDAFKPNFELFKKNHSKNLHFRLSYTHQLDVKKNIAPPINFSILEKNEVSPNKELQYYPPFVSYHHSTKRLAGNFYINTSYQVPIDSVEMTIDNAIDTLSIRPSLSYRVGYSIHFGNFRSDLYEHRDNGIRADVFLSAELYNQQFHLNKKDFIARANLIKGNISAGGRIGHYPFGLSFAGGGGWSFLLSKQFYSNVTDSEDFKFNQLENWFIFAAVGVRNSLYLRANYYRTTNAVLNPANKKQSLFEISLGFGI